MPPRLQLFGEPLPTPIRCRRLPSQREILRSCRSSRTASTAAAAAAISPAASIAPISRFPSSQPPSHRSPEYRRSQLLRQYTSLIRTSSLMVFFQHNNLQATEWSAIRRELSKALHQVDGQMLSEGRNVPPLAQHSKLQIIQTSIFEVAFRIVEYFRPQDAALNAVRPPRAVDPVTQTSAELLLHSGSRDDPTLSHDLSRAAHDAVMRMKGKHELSPLLFGPIAVLSIPLVSPEHLKAALSVLAPKSVGYPTPTRRANPQWHELPVQNGLQKLNVLAARIDGRVFDVPETKWVGSIEGGMDGLRVQLVRALESMGAGVTSVLEGAGKSLYLTMESRRSALEEEQESQGGMSES